MLDLREIWKSVEAYEGQGSKHFELSPYRVQLYRGAMEIPLVAFFSKTPAPFYPSWIEKLAQILSALGLDLECVEEGRNYKINTSDTKLYMGRMTCEALKLHAPRFAEKGFEAFDQIVQFYFTLDRGEP